MKILTDIYRSGKKEGLYLYVKKEQDLNDLPELLMKQFGKAEFSMRLLLTEDKKLARADAKEVCAALEDKGFYLQMPPSEADLQAEQLRLTQQFTQASKSCDV